MDKNLIDTIGSTPVIKLSKFAPNLKVFAKLESRNPCCSVKDRTALGMIRYAEAKGNLKPKQSIVEPTSGNTGIGLAWLCNVLGYKLTLTMPETMSAERRQLLKHLGATIVLTEGAKGMKGAMAQAQKISAEKGSILLNQFNNPGNPQIHYQTTGPELWDQMEGKIDIAVFGVGTGGTLTGAGKYLKSKNAKLKIVAVEPADSPVLSGGQPGPHKIQGIGAGFIPDILEVSLIDDVVTVTNDQAIKTAKALAQAEGLLVGISCGAAAWAARKVAQKNPVKRLIVILPDTAERYISTDLFKTN